MRKIVAALNMSLDGFCDHTAGIPDADLHQHYTHLLEGADAILYGRTTYELMEYWRTVLEEPSEEQFMNDFAVAIDKLPKIVFSHSMQNVDWPTAAIAKGSLEEEVLALKQREGKEILVGSRSLIVQLLKQNLIDELQICIHPVVVGEGLSLFQDIGRPLRFDLVSHKAFDSGVLLLVYRPWKEAEG